MTPAHHARDEHRYPATVGEFDHVGHQETTFNKKVKNDESPLPTTY